jgi:TPR repeat protein
MRIKLLCVLSLVFMMSLNGCQSPSVAAYHRGNTAFKDGDYTLSFTNYLYAAEQGIVPAQYAVAYQYYYGLGTPSNYVDAAKWLNKAAPHSLRARYALQKLKAFGGTEPWAYGLHWK